MTDGCTPRGTAETCSAATSPSSARIRTGRRPVLGPGLRNGRRSRAVSDLGTHWPLRPNAGDEVELRVAVYDANDDSPESVHGLRRPAGPRTRPGALQGDMDANMLLPDGAIAFRTSSRPWTPRGHLYRPSTGSLLIPPATRPVPAGRRPVSARLCGRCGGDGERRRRLRVRDPVVVLRAKAPIPTGTSPTAWSTPVAPLRPRALPGRWD